MNCRARRWLSIGFLLAGIGLLVLVARWHFQEASSPPPGPWLEAEATDVELTDCVPGQKREVVLTLRNHSDKPLRILGIGGC